MLPKLKGVKENDNLVLFYLDAHWHDNWPILSELKIIGEYFYDKAIIVIDDFYVPNRDFKCDSYKNQKLSFNYIKNNLDLCYSDYSYYYNNNPHMVTDKKPSGKIYIIPNCLFNETISKNDLFLVEEDIPYSKNVMKYLIYVHIQKENIFVYTYL